MKKNIALVMGGFSGEHQISINSGCQVYDSLDKRKYNVYKIVIGHQDGNGIDRNQWYWLADNGEHRPVDRADFTVTDGGKKVRFDLAFIIIHGNPGETGQAFTRAAQEHSDCPSAQNGGSLGWFGRGMMVPEFDHAAFSMKCGEVSDVIETQFGYHIILKTDEKPGGQQTLVDVADMIRDRLRHEARGRATEAFVAELREKAKIEYR